MKIRLTAAGKAVQNFLWVTCLFLVMLLNGSCARSYYKLQPEELSYTQPEQKNGLTFSYQYSILRNKYLKKEDRKNIKLIAVKCINNTDRDLVFGTDIQLIREKGEAADFAGESYVYDKLRQRPASHLWWLLFTFFTVSFTEGSTYGGQKTTTIPVGFALGPILTLTNVSVAAGANKGFKADLKKYNLLGRTIPKGDTVFGVVGVRTLRYEKLSLKDSNGN